ncbi:SRPBCC domain-containing protein [Georgenia sp. TF02-10]|uniref:SRPBCC domain-containing protein n=1 Tax=Georgenia sp. TF02-10 TaxID=2917725 RepID=UPI001FA6D566|nr:SRPBCC domain-containing protein [Georgenia sp. TF02-10]UNX53198.1 SRPBCC domain-containing protein [Georgenia sp. TF02-10]
MNDIANQDASLRAVQRRLTSTQTDHGPATAAVLRRRLEAPIQDVWAAVTTPNRVDRYFLPLSGDLRDGGRYAFEGQASGRILACVAPNLLRLEWVPPDRGEADQVEVRLTADGDDATWLELEHASVADVFHTDLSGARFSPVIGWEGPLHYLGEYLRGVLPDRPSTEWYVLDEVEELRLATLRAAEWATAEAAYADSGGSR